MFVIPNSDNPSLSLEEEQMFESVIHDISAELGHSVVARGLRSIAFTTYQKEDGRRLMFEFHTVGTPQVPLDEFQRVLTMRFVQILWERHRKRCFPLGLPPDDRKFCRWPAGRPDYVIARQPAEAEAEALPDGLAPDPDEPCPCGSGRKYKDCCMP